MHKLFVTIDIAMNTEIDSPSVSRTSLSEGIQSAVIQILLSIGPISNRLESGVSIGLARNTSSNSLLCSRLE